VPTRFKLPDMQFGTIVADPPWPFDDKNEKQYAMAHRGHFDRMSLKDICDIPVGDVIHPDGHLWLWVTNPGLKMAFEVVDAWGFTYKTMATWRKSKLGLGWWLRSRTEHLILAARSTRLRTAPGSWSTDIKGKYRGYGKKPVDAYKMIEALSPGPYLELFTREENGRPNWIQLGEHKEMSEAYNQSQFKKLGTPNTPDPSDGVARGVGGLKIEVDNDYYYLEKALIPRKVHVLGQTGRRVSILFPAENGEEPKKRSVSVDNLRDLTYTERDHGTGRGRLIWLDAGGKEVVGKRTR
jgi:N6-adenosine-specific RNA methylase IME4